MLIQCAEQPVFLQCLGYCSPLVPILQPWQTSACKRRHTFSKIAAWVLVCKAQTIVSPVAQYHLSILYYSPLAGNYSS